MLLPAAGWCAGSAVWCRDLAVASCLSVHMLYIHIHLMNKDTVINMSQHMCISQHTNPTQSKSEH